MRKTLRSFQSYMNLFQGANEPPEEVKGSSAANDINNLLNYYFENRLFFDESLAKDIDNLMKTFRIAWDEFSLSRRFPKHSNQWIEKWENSWKIISKEAPSVLEKIENNFRKILGVTDS